MFYKVIICRAACFDAIILSLCQYSTKLLPNLPNFIIVIRRILCLEAAVRMLLS